MAARTGTGWAGRWHSTGQPEACYAFGPLHPAPERNSKETQVSDSQILSLA